MIHHGHDATVHKQENQQIHHFIHPGSKTSNSGQSWQVKMDLRILRRQSEYWQRIDVSVTTASATYDCEGFWIIA